jgi:hypothetical protein
VGGRGRQTVGLTWTVRSEKLPTRLGCSTRAYFTSRTDICSPWGKRPLVVKPQLFVVFSNLGNRMSTVPLSSSLPSPLFLLLSALSTSEGTLLQASPPVLRCRRAPHLFTPIRPIYETRCIHILTLKLLEKIVLLIVFGQHRWFNSGCPYKNMWNPQEMPSSPLPPRRFLSSRKYQHSPPPSTPQHPPWSPHRVPQRKLF